MHGGNKPVAYCVHDSGPSPNTTHFKPEAVTRVAGDTKDMPKKQMVLDKVFDQSAVAEKIGSRKY